ncbi:interleukin-6 [Sphaerodactylus townsendi]|uniref:interleukin-6 n=1 Tax=Sphaerodactylus townsendi TaxID=933632 RepID=UPI002026437F|nr:interleukin-6 [Sphaerodactylus townsendi]
MLALAERCLWVTAALSVLLQASASPILDYSGEEQSSEDPSSKPLPTRYSQLRNCVRLAKELRNRASQLWKKELCEKQTICQNNTEILSQNNLRFPKITTQDECPPHGFNKERCLRGISSGLYAYQAFLEYINKTFISEEQKTAPLWLKTKELAHTLQSMTNTPDTVTMPSPDTQEALSTQLHRQTGWNRKVIHYLILQDYVLFMQKTIWTIRGLIEIGWE